MQKTLETWVLSLRLTAWNQVLLLLLFSHSVVSDSLQPHGLQHARLPCPSPTPGACSNSMSIESVMASNHLILCCPLLLLPSIFPSIRVFFNESALLIRWPKYWSFSFSISPSNEYLGSISFRIDWLDLLAVQGTFKSRLQHHSSKASIFWRSAFFMVQLSYPYRTTGKSIALTVGTFVGKVMFSAFFRLNSCGEFKGDRGMPSFFLFTKRWLSRPWEKFLGFKAVKRLTELFKRLIYRYQSDGAGFTNKSFWKKMF